MTESITTFLVKDQTFSFYANLDTLETSSTFSSWHLHLLNEDFIIEVGDIGTLTKDIISGSSYRFYSSFVVPINLTAGACYYLAVVDATDSTVKYLSNKLIASNSIKSNMKLIRYRNDKNILNFNYESLSTLYNQFVIELAVIQSQYPTTRIGYRS